MKKRIIELTEKDWSKLPIIVAIAGPSMALISVFSMLGILSFIQRTAVAEHLPTWFLQLAVMSPWISFIAVIITAILAVITLIILDISVHHNIEEYKKEFFNITGIGNKNNSQELYAEVFDK